MTVTYQRSLTRLGKLRLAATAATTALVVAVLAHVDAPPPPSCPDVAAEVVRTGNYPGFAVAGPCIGEEDSQLTAELLRLHNALVSIPA